MPFLRTTLAATEGDRTNVEKIQKLSDRVVANTDREPKVRGFGEGDNEHPIGPDYTHRTAPTYFNMRKTSIYGGSNEIQRNIIAKMVLGL